MTTKTRECVIVIKDNGNGDIEYGADYGLEAGETMPDDVEELSEAQYATFRIIRVLDSMGDEEAMAQLKEEAETEPTGILVPRPN